MSASRHAGPLAPGRRLRWRIARVGPTPIYVSAAWLLFAALVIAFYAPVVHRHGASWLAAVGVSAGIAVLWAFSVLLHELGHLVAARLMGTRVLQVEIGLTGGLTDTETDDERPSEQLWVSVAGPLVSIVLGLPGLVSLLAGHGLAFGEHGNVGLVLATFSLSNLVVGVFNLLPGLPLDGGHVLVAAVWRATGSRAAGVRVAAVCGLVLAVATSVGGVVVLVVLPESWATAAVALLLAWGFWDMASSSLRHSRLATRLEGRTVEGLVEPVPVAPLADTAAAVLDRAGADPWTVLVEPDGAPVAVVASEAIARVPAVARTALHALDLGTRLEPRDILRPDTSLLELAARERSRRTPYVVVEADGTVVGILVGKVQRTDDREGVA